MIWFGLLKLLQTYFQYTVSTEPTKMMDKLVEVEIENWPALRDLYAADDPNTYLGHCTVDNYIRWFEKEPNTRDWVFYSLNGDWSDGTYILINQCYACAFTLAKSGERLTRLVQLLDFSKQYKFMDILKKDYPAILEGLKRQNVEIILDMEFFMFHLPLEEALHFEPNIPIGIKLQPLRECDADLLNSERPDLSNDNVDFVRRLIRLNPTVGAYTDDGELIAWFLRVIDGQVGGLHVLREHYGRGLGRTVAKYLLRKIADSGHMNVLTIREGNKCSRNIFEPMGFKLVGKVNRIFTAPKTTKN